MTPFLTTKERGMPVPPAPPQRDERRTEALKTALAQIEKQFGKGSIMRLGGDAKMDIEGITTGSLGLDLALGGKEVQACRFFHPRTCGENCHRKL